MANTWYCSLQVDDVSKHDYVRGWFERQGLEFTRSPDSNTFCWQNRGAPSFDRVVALSTMSTPLTFEAEDIMGNVLVTLSIGPSPNLARIHEEYEAEDAEMDALSEEDAAKRSTMHTWLDKDLPF